MRTAINPFSSASKNVITAKYTLVYDTWGDRISLDLALIIPNMSGGGFVYFDD